MIQPIPIPRLATAVSQLRRVAWSLTGCLALLSGALADDPESNFQVGMERVLFELEDAPRISAETLLAALVRSGPQALAELQEELADYALEGSALEGTVLDRSKARAIARALDEIPEWVSEHVNPITELSRQDILHLKLGLEILETAPGSDGCSRAARLASPKSKEQRPHRAAVKALEQTLSARLRAHPNEALSLEEHVTDGHPGLVQSIVRAAGRAPSTETLDFLLWVLSEKPELDLLILAELGRVTITSGSQPTIELERRVDSFLSSTRSALRREAALVAGRLELFNSVPRLIGLLSDENGGVADNALWALERITNERLGLGPERWSRWHRRELAWWSLEARTAFEALRSSDPTEISRGLRQLSGHNHFRHAISEEIALVLNCEEGFLVAQACAALCALRSPVALEPLRQALLHDSKSAPLAAWEALKALTGRDLPPNPEAWAQAEVRPHNSR